jgi:hypothetical protein
MDSGLAASRRSGMTLTPILSPPDACKFYFLQRVYFTFPQLPLPALLSRNFSLFL